jgi:hypothetical protein
VPIFVTPMSASPFRDESLRYRFTPLGGRHHIPAPPALPKSAARGMLGRGRPRPIIRSASRFGEPMTSR